MLVSGDLGAGKTTFVRGACRALGVTGPVTSPSFTIARRYDGAVPISHLDLYRLGEPRATRIRPCSPTSSPATASRSSSGPRSARRSAWKPERVAARVRLEHRGGDRRGVFIDLGG